jgi:dinuclear metal center YbgI/SA1388 family protein
MASRDELIAHLDDLLRPGDFEDITPNGLQVPGAGEVDLVVTGVSPGVELFERASAEGAQMVLCHHGLLGAFQPERMTPMLKRRLEVLFAADISLAAYHLPLDAHPEVGNNALICEHLGLTRAEPFGLYKGKALGFVGRAAEGLPLAQLRERCASAFGRDPFIFEYGPDPVHSLGIVSGGAPSTLTEAVAKGLDGFLTGESAEHVMLEARESGLHFIAGGHYGTETFGVRRLGDLLSERFGVRHLFIDVPNPV